MLHLLIFIGIAVCVDGAASGCDDNKTAKKLSAGNFSHLKNKKLDQKSETKTNFFFFWVVNTDLSWNLLNAKAALANHYCSIGNWKAFVLDWELGVTYHSLSPALLPCSTLYITQLLFPANLLKAVGNVLSWGRSPRRPFWQMALSPFILKVWNVHTYYGISKKMSKPNFRLSNF